MRPQQHSMNSFLYECPGKRPIMSRLRVIFVYALGPIMGLSCSSVPHRELPSEYAWEEASLRAYVGANHNAAASLRDLGVIYLRTGRFEKATEALEYSTVEDRSDPESWFYAGLSYEFQNDPGAALGKYRASPHRSGKTVYSQATNGRIRFLEQEEQTDDLFEKFSSGFFSANDSLESGLVSVFPLACSISDPAYAGLGNGFSDLLAFHIGDVQGVSTVDPALSREAIEMAVSAQRPQGMGAPESAARILRSGGMIGGTCVETSAGLIRIDLVYRDLINETSTSVDAETPLQNLLDLENTLVDSLVYKLGLFAPNRNRNTLRGMDGLESIRHYSAGLQAEQERDLVEALAHFNRALNLNSRLLIAETKIEKIKNMVLATASTQSEFLDLLLKLESLTSFTELRDQRISGLSWNLGYGFFPGQGTRRLPPGNAGELPTPPTPTRN